MRTIAALLLFILFSSLLLPGCGKIDGPRFWWDDRTQERLPEDYTLPADPAAPTDSGQERTTDASGEDLTDQDLRDYRTDFDADKQRSEERNVPQGFNQALERPGQ